MWNICRPISTTKHTAHMKEDENLGKRGGGVNELNRFKTANHTCCIQMQRKRDRITHSFELTEVAWWMAHPSSFHPHESD